jgi:predicted CXXCH cytochrome family protein
MLSLPALETLEVKVNDVTPPVIKSPEIIGVYQGTMVSSRIGWLTDEESDTEVRYGIDTLQYSAKADHFTTAHEIVLQNLQANQQYQYIVISRDIFGNQAESGRAFFNTEQFSPYSPVEFEQYQETEDLFDAHFFRNGDSYLVKFTAVQPVILSVGTEAGNAETGKIPVAVFVTDPDHVPLRNRSELSLSVCLKCHAGFAGTNMHPVNRHPSGKVTVPADYPTSPDGRITCISCHASHASNFQFRTIRSASKDLCIGCHEGYAPSL